MPAWELKIDAERLQDKENDDWEEESGKIPIDIYNYGEKNPAKEVVKLKG